ncbi:MAG TPA: hypothetical protein VF715_19710 [Thermoleophilaceae bacterium]
MGRSLTVVAALLVALAAAAPSAGAAERRVPVGFHGVDFDREAAWAPAKVQTAMWGEMTRTGVESARVIFDWSEAQPQAVLAPSFHETDPLVANAAAQGIEPLPVVIYAPPWAREVPSSKASAPSDLTAYGAYLRALVKRYGPGGTFWAEHPELRAQPIRAWQVWNEPDMEYQWTPQRDWHQKYGALVRAADAVLSEADPGARLVLAGLTNFSWRELRTLYERGEVRGHFDVAALNAYTRDPKNLVEIVRRARKVMDVRGDRKKAIRVTEFGASASLDRLKVGRDQDHLQTTDRKLAKLVLGAYDALAANRRRLRIERAYWYTWASHYEVRDGAGIFDFTGLVAYRENASGWSARQALGAYRKSARRLQGR